MLFVAPFSLRTFEHFFLAIIEYCILQLTSMDRIHGNVERKLENMPMESGYMAKLAQFLRNFI